MFDAKFKIATRESVQLKRVGKSEGESIYQELYEMMTGLDAGKGIIFQDIDEKQRQKILAGLKKLAEKDSESPKAKSATLVAGGFFFWLEYPKGRDAVKSAKKDVESVTKRYGKIQHDSKD